MNDQSGAFVLGIVGGMFLLIGSILSTVFCWGLPTDIGIDLHTEKITGVVTSAEMAQNRRINRRYPLCITYTYRVGGRTFSDDHDTIDTDYQAAYAQVGSAVPLEIDAQHPERSRIAGTRRSLFGYGGALTLFFPLVGVAVLGSAAYMGLRRSRRATSRGTR